MAVGKSRIGSLLAARLRLPFIDADREIERAYGLSVAEIFTNHGEAEFRGAERQVIARLMAEKPRVIAVGGGAFVDASNREAINRAARSVWLDTPFELILPRARRSTSRPLATERSESELHALWQQRRPAYAQAHVRIDTSDEDAERIIDRIIEVLVSGG